MMILVQSVTTTALNNFKEALKQGHKTVALMG